MSEFKFLTPLKILKLKIIIKNLNFLGLHQFSLMALLLRDSKRRKFTLCQPTSMTPGSCPDLTHPPNNAHQLIPIEFSTNTNYHRLASDAKARSLLMENRWQPFTRPSNASLMTRFKVFALRITSQCGRCSKMH